MRVGADEGVWIRKRVRAFNLFRPKDHAGQVFKVDLVDDPSIRRHDAEIAEGILSPAQKRISLFVPLEIPARR